MDSGASLLRVDGRVSRAARRVPLPGLRSGDADCAECPEVNENTPTGGAEADAMGEKLAGGRDIGHPLVMDGQSR